MEAYTAKLREESYTILREINMNINKISHDIINTNCDVGLIVASINHTRTLVAKSRAINQEYARLVAKKGKGGDSATQ